MSSDTDRPHGFKTPISRSAALAERIRAEITRDDGIEFSRFMELALYAPRLGYYTSGARVFGAGGDFVTAPELGSLFGTCLGRQCAEVLAALGSGDILEFGAGTGRLACDVLLELERAGRLPRHYQIVELSPELRTRQRAAIVAAAPHLVDRVRWLTTLPAPGYRGVVIANEVIDAMPVTRFRVLAQGVGALYVLWDGQRFVDQVRPVGTPRIDGVDVNTLPVGYTSEVCPRAGAWLRTVAQLCAQAAVLVIDYGFPAREYYHPDRCQGTLMCHYRHRAHTDPYCNIGLQDITAHVDFSALAVVGAESGFEVAGYTQLAPFLMALGVTDAVAARAYDNEWQRVTVVQELKKLTLPFEMGELFKVIAFTKECDVELKGFSLLDHRGRL